MAEILNVGIVKQVAFAKEHSNVKNGAGAVIFKQGKNQEKIWVIGFSHLPLTWHYQSEEQEQYPELHISAVMDVIMKIGSYKMAAYGDLDIAVSDPISILDLGLILEMGFKSLWIAGEKVNPQEYFRECLKAGNLQLTF